MSLRFAKADAFFKIIERFILMTLRLSSQRLENLDLDQPAIATSILCRLRHTFQ